MKEKRIFMWYYASGPKPTRGLLSPSHRAGCGRYCVAHPAMGRPMGRGHKAHTECGSGAQSVHSTAHGATDRNALLVNQ
jgi:hypothetical protein